MKSLNGLILLSLIINPLYADQFPVDISVPKLKGKDRVDIAKNLINDLSRRASSLDTIFVTIPDEDLNKIENEICVECERLTPLASEVNAILKKQAHNLPDSDELKLETQSLEGIISYVSIVESNGRTRCHKIENFDTTEEFRSINDEELVFVFKEEVDGFKMRTVMFSNSGNQTAYFRGKGKDADKLVRVDMDGQGKSYITYYKIKNVKDIITYEDEKRKLEQDLSLPSLGDGKVQKERIGKGVIDSSLNTHWTGENGHVRASIGPKVEYKNFLPNKVTVVDFDNEIQLTTKTTIKSDAMVTSSGTKATATIEDETIPGAKVKTSYTFEPDKQSVGMSVKAKDGPGISGNVEIVDEKRNVDVRLIKKDDNPYVYMKLKDEGDYLVGLPYQLESGDYGIGGELQYQNTGERRVNMSVMHQGKSMVDTSLAATETSRSIGVSKSKTFKDNSTLSIKFENTRNTVSDASDNTFWLSYKKRF